MVSVALVMFAFFRGLLGIPHLCIDWMLSSWLETGADASGVATAAAVPNESSTRTGNINLFGKTSHKSFPRSPIIWVIQSYKLSLGALDYYINKLAVPLPQSVFFMFFSHGFLPENVSRLVTHRTSHLPGIFFCCLKSSGNKMRKWTSTMLEVCSTLWVTLFIASIKPE